MSDYGLCVYNVSISLRLD